MSSSEAAPYMTLGAALDEIWRQPQDRHEVAAKLAHRLVPEAQRALVAWDAASIVGPRSGLLRLVDGDFEILDRDGFAIADGTVSPADPETAFVVRVPEFDLVAYVRGRPSPKCEHGAASLLVAVQRVRDHYDSIAMHPPAMRQAELDMLARETSESRDQIDRWVRWTPALLQLTDGERARRY